MYLKGALQFIDRVIDRVSYAGSVISGILLTCMVALVTAAVIGRYVFRTPLIGSEEIVTMIFPGVVFLALAYADRKDLHIRATILSDKFPVILRLLLFAIGDLIAIGVVSIISWQFASYALRLLEGGCCSLVIGIPAYIIALIAALGTGLAVLSFVTTFARRVSELTQRGRLFLLWLFPTFAVALLLLTMPWWLSWLPIQFSKMQYATMGIIGMISLLMLGLRVSVVMLFIGFVGTALTHNINAGLATMALTSYSYTTMYSWIAMPLFILMGNFVSEAGFARDVYTTAQTWLGRLPGGLAISAVAGCAIFASASGSSLATALTIGRIGLPQMRRYKYDDSLATGCIAAGGTLGILIPPSIGFIVYGLITEASIGKLFMAGIFPGIILATMFMSLIFFRVKKNPSLATPAPGSNFREKIISLKGTIGILLLFILVIGGIYLGVITPNEGGGVGAFGALILAAIMKRWSWRRFLNGIRDGTASNSIMIFIMLGAMIVGHFVTASGVPILLSRTLAALPVGKWAILGLILVFYIIVGCILNIMPAMMITLPMLFPAIMALGFDPIWFGVVMVITMEMGQITPPVGIVVFALSGAAGDVPMATIFKGIFPFLAMMPIVVGLLIMFPQIATFLPSITSG